MNSYIETRDPVFTLEKKYYAPRVTFYDVFVFKDIEKLLVCDSFDTRNRR